MSLERIATKLFKPEATEKQTKYALELMDSFGPIFELRDRGEDLHAVFEKFYRGSDFQDVRSELDEEILPVFNVLDLIVKTENLMNHDREYHSADIIGGISMSQFLRILFSMKKTILNPMVYYMGVQIPLVDNHCKTFISDMSCDERRHLPPEDIFHYIKVMWKSYCANYEEGSRLLYEYLEKNAFNGFCNAMKKGFKSKTNPNYVPENYGKKHSLNCEGRAKLMICLLRKTFPHLKLFLSTNVSSDAGHVFAVFQLPGNNSYYAIDGGIYKMSKPPVYLDPPEMVFANNYINTVLGGGSPFKLKYGLSEEDQSETEKFVVQEFCEKEEKEVSRIKKEVLGSIYLDVTRVSENPYSTNARAESREDQEFTVDSDCLEFDEVGLSLPDNCVEDDVSSNASKVLLGRNAVRRCISRLLGIAMLFATCSGAKVVDKLAESDEIGDITVLNEINPDNRKVNVTFKQLCEEGEEEDKDCIVIADDSFSEPDEDEDLDAVEAEDRSMF